MNPSPLEQDSPELSGLAAAGTWLQAARMAKGFTLEQVSQETRIGKPYLEAVEAGDLEKLPGIAYTRGFVRLYASYLGLSADEGVALMSRGAREIPAEAEKKIEIITPQTLNRIKPRTIAIASLALLFLFMVLTRFTAEKKVSTPPENPRIQAPSPQSQTPATAPVPEPSAPSPPPSEPQKPASAESSAESVVLRLKVVTDGRLHITIDNAISQEYDLVSGDLVEWKAESSILLDLEDGGAVEGELNSKPINLSGEKGKGLHLRLDANGISKR